MAFGWLLVAVVSHSIPTYSVQMLFPQAQGVTLHSITAVCVTGIRLLTNAFFFHLFPQTTAILGLLAYYGFTNSSSNIDGHPVSVWGESTLSRSSRGAEKLELLKSDKLHRLDLYWRCDKARQETTAISTLHYAFENKVFFR
jgi:hypothetical protein